MNEKTKQVLAIGGSSGARKDKDTVERMEELIPSCGTSICSNDHNGVHMYMYSTKFDIEHYTTITCTHEYVAQHAEYMAIATYKGAQSLKGCTIYCTRMPCTECAKLIAQTGIKSVVYKDELQDHKEITERIFKKCNIELRYIC